jgi:hypothetical protein
MLLHHVPNSSFLVAKLINNTCHLCLTLFVQLNSMGLKPSREAATCSDIQVISNILRTPIAVLKLQVQKLPNVQFSIKVSVSYYHLTSAIFSKRSILISSLYPHVGLRFVSFQVGFLTSSFCSFTIFLHSCYLFSPIQPPLSYLTKAGGAPIIY